jgi:acetyl-CoA C-acetyltransferase
MDAAAVVAVGQTDHRSRRLDVGIPELVREAVDRCLVSRSLDLAEIDAFVFGNMEMFEGIYLVEQYLVDALGAVGKPLIKLNTGGTVGTSVAIAATSLVASGRYGTVLAVGFEKQSEGSSQSAITTVGDPIWERSVMAGAIGNMALMASSFVDFAGVTPEQAARTAVKARRNGARNPHAHLKLPDLTVDDVLASPMLAHPIRRLDMCPTSDGAVAVLFAGGRRAKELADRPAWVHAAVSAHDQQYMGDSPRRLAFMRSARSAAQKAYAKAGIEVPLRDLDVAEIYEPSSYFELAMYENLGFCGPGEAGRLIDRGVTEMDGVLPVNPSGGVMCTNPVGATALIRVAEAGLQVMREAGDRQVDGAERALATGYGGNAWTDLLVLSSQAPREAVAR